MRALRFDRFGSLDALALLDVDVPAVRSGEVLVRVHAAGVNPSDVKNVLGGFPYTTVPRTPGRDVAGEVVDGPRALIGRRVWASGRELGFLRDGTHAEYVAAPADGVTRMPEKLTFAEAASVPVPYVTALEALDRGGVRAGTALVVIGFGAVGSAAHALATARGARVAVGVRRAEQAAELVRDGVDAFAFTDPEGFAAGVRERCAEGAEVVFDSTGFHLPATVPVLAPGGRIVVIAAPADGHERVPVRELYRRGGSLIGVNSLLHDTVATAAALETLTGLFESGALAVPTGIELRSLDRAVATYFDLAAGVPAKFVLTPTDRI
ncbi:zinc-binding alcohol dehydrogenase family protein [Nocardia sp. NEAU-G5]|uniref:Zinc-binding alcohol dehydrogenase family protein n=1 Tax=Nocardia albiluteola TaxID=2842303 RepID=A0ABS6B3F3_9NOCA|nr:zinc-binding alcohol dehydrogenase family protein [Nocardia albiluteola]MBU3064764.1 zinc-binding alcohol dehydrogenase family protein [Nocardia albiluteola]